MDVERFASLHSPSGALISVYLDRSAGPSSSVLNELLKPVRAAGDELAHSASMSVRSDVERIESSAARFDADPSPAWAIFASETDGLFEVLPLAHVVPSSAAVGRRPNVRPLRALPRPVRSLVLVVERPRVELWKVDGAIEKIGMFQGDLGKDNYGGFLGFDEKVVASRAEEETARVWREAGAAALSEHQARRADLVVVAGHHQHLDQFTSQLHPYLREAVIEHIVVDPHTVTPALLLDRVRGLEQRVRIRRDELAVQAVLEASYAGRPVARGLIDVLTAANLGAIDLLVVSGPFAKPGVRCDECGWLARSGVECPSCGAGTDAVDDVVGAAIESVLARGGRAPQVSVGSALDADGVAALLRFPLPAV